ncbi:MAG: B12-binding domain-containing radical SAM protein [Bacteroidia bacterium]|nr:B12-binding domain-containing radical SAM protein [Bacteroidia bacterium]
MRILLINPPVLAVFEPWYDTPDFGRVGLAYVAAWLRQFPGYEIRILDAKFERLNFVQVLEKVRDWQPDLVGFTAYTNEIKPAAYQAALIKRDFPKIITVIGGVHVTSIPVQTLAEFPSFDLGVVGEGEETFHKLCETLQSGGELNQVAGIVFREGEEIRQTQARPRILDQNSLPFPAWDLMPPAETYFIQTIRGCPFDCQFCMNPNGRVARKRSVENVLEEIELLIEKYHPKRISFGDELFSVDMKRTHDLLDLMIAHRVGDRTSWDVQTHVKYVDFALLKKMKEAKVTRVEMGVETGDESKLKSMGKGTNFTMIMDAVNASRRAGVTTGMFFLFGHPNETENSLKETIRMAVKTNPHLPMFGLMTPYPGTEIASLAAEGKGGYRLLTTDWDEYNKQIGGAMEFANLSRRQIEKFQLIAYASVFLRNGRFMDFVKFVWEYRWGAWAVLKKVFSGKKKLADFQKKPADYETMINSPGPVKISEMVTAFQEWKDIQRDEMIRAKREKPELLEAVKVGKS